MLIFLDFDGVLQSAYAVHQEHIFNRLPFSQVPIFEAFFRQPKFEHFEFVISSTWRCGYTLAQLRTVFSPEFRMRIIGKTPEDVATSPIGSREQEILQYLRDVGREDEMWLALDDVHSYFDRYMNRVFFCASLTGLTEQDLPQLATWIESHGLLKK